jgi:hypothetical protein
MWGRVLRAKILETKIGGIVMAWLAVDKIGEELISRTEPFRVGDYWIGYSIFHLPKGSIKKLIGRELSWSDEPVELKGE